MHAYMCGGGGGVWVRVCAHAWVGGGGREAEKVMTF